MDVENARRLDLWEDRHPVRPDDRAVAGIGPTHWRGDTVCARGKDRGRGPTGVLTSEVDPSSPSRRRAPGDRSEKESQRKDASDRAMRIPPGRIAGPSRPE